VGASNLWLIRRHLNRVRLSLLLAPVPTTHRARKLACSQSAARSARCDDRYFSHKANTSHRWWLPLGHKDCATPHLGIVRRTLFPHPAASPRRQNTHTRESGRFRLSGSPKTFERPRRENRLFG